jgi:hypothetical protein
MKTPTLHLNGTGAKMLLEGYNRARRAIFDAHEALRAVEFNARDYYPQGPEAWPAARDEMGARFQALDGIRRDLEAIELSIMDQEDERTARRATAAA